MAGSGLDHLKNDYRRRFCRPSRAPDINTEQSQNMLEILENCFEEKSLIDDFITNSTKSVLYLTPSIKNSGIQSPSKDCQKSHPKSFQEATLQGVVEPTEAASGSVQVHEIHQKVLTADVCSKSTPDLKKKSGKKLNGLCAEADEEFYISVGSPTVLLHGKPSESQNAISSAQKRETHTFGNSVNMLSSSTEISLKTKKRLNFEDKDILRKVERETNKSEVEDKVSGQKERRRSETSPKRVQDVEHEIPSQAKKSFSTLFLETVKRKGESSPVVRHTAMAPSHSSPPSDAKLLEDEFIIDESERSFAHQSWITIPKKGRPLNQPTVSSAESAAVLQDKKARQHQSVSPVTLTSNKHLHKAHPEEKSRPSSEQKPNTSCILIDELETQSPSRNKRKNRKAKQEQKKKMNTNVVEEQPATGWSKDENMSDIAQDNLPKNSGGTLDDCEKIRNDDSAKKEMPPVENMKTKCRSKKDKKESRKKHISRESKRKEQIPEEMTSTVTRSRRISRRPSDWWVVRSEESPVHSNSLRNDISVYHNSRRKPAKKTNQSSKNIVKKTVPSKRQKTSTRGSSRVQKFLNVENSRGITDHDEVSSCPQKESLENDKTDLTKKKNLDCSRTTRHSKDQDEIMSTQNVRLKSQISEDTCKTPVESNLESGESKASVLEESGPSRLKNYLMSGNNNSDVNNEVQESLDNSRVKGCKVAPRNNMHYKLVLPSNTPGVRRTKRIRSKPLEYWRGERVDYQETPSGGFVIGGILSPETVTSKRKAKGNVEKVNKIHNRKRICLDNVERKSRLVVNCDIPLGDPFQPTQVKDPETREIILMDLIRPRDTYQFFVEHGELKVYKTLDTPFFSTGKLILGPYEEKGKQHVGEDILVFYVNVGDLLCTLHETPYTITTGDSFYVPSGNYYNIKNLLNEESILLFTQIKR
ncbi:PREDICTED: centromere protein C [Chinchilla lanigera]|uniref:Centromere protein C n=1 Tax=Chinchilla lanigera TaxID=34839 RepID=A0A8C2V5A3_CHILA|nr:PREDICTED: centromere protein C [Chinchilla lanigera]